MRRYLPLLLIAALWVPLLATIWPPRDVPLAENRRLAPALALPNSWSELRASPAAIDEWAKDHFGFRKQLLVAHSRLRFWLFGEYPSDTLLAGKGGEIFFRFGKSGNTVLLELCGVGLSQATINARTAKIADFLSRIRRLDAKTHVLAVPEKSRVYPDKLPDWMQRECALGAPPPANHTDGPCHNAWTWQGRALPACGNAGHDATDLPGRQFSLEHGRGAARSRAYGRNTVWLEAERDTTLSSKPVVFRSEQFHARIVDTDPGRHTRLCCC